MDWPKIRSDLTLGFGSQFVYKVFGYVILALLARHLTQAELGQFLYASALAGLVILFSELGTSTHLVREVSARPAHALESYSAVLTARAPLVALHVLVVTAFVALTRPGIVGVALAAAVYVGLRDLHRTAASVLIGLRKIGAAVLIYGAGLLFLAAGVLLVLSNGGGLDGVLIVYVVWGVLLFTAGLATVRVQLRRFRVARRSGFLRAVVRSSFPLFALDVLALAHFKADTILLGLMTPFEEVAGYEAAAKLLEASQFLVRPLTLVFFPICSALAHDGEWERLSALLPRMTVAALLVGTALAGGVIAAAPWIIPQVFGEGFDRSVPLLRILYASVPGLFAVTVATFVGNALHAERKVLPLIGAGVALNIGLNLLWIPRAGALGAAWATLVSQSLMALVLVAVVVRELGTRKGGDGEPPEVGG